MKAEMTPLVRRSRLKELPHDHAALAVDIILGHNEIYPSPLLFEQVTEIGRDIDRALRYQDSPYAVVTPVATRSKTDKTYSWGPSTITNGGNGSFSLAFPEVDCPATCPPVSVMNILTPGSSRNIRILQEPNVNFVTRADVQKEVIRWIREIADREQTINGGVPLSRVSKVSLPDGTEVEVELWQWRGLKRRGLESDAWEMFL